MRTRMVPRHRIRRSGRCCVYRAPASCDSSLRLASSWSKIGPGPQLAVPALTAPAGLGSESPGPLEGLDAMRRRGTGLGGLRGGVPGGPRPGGIALEGGTAGRPRGRRLGQRRSRAWASASGGVSSAHAATDSPTDVPRRTAPNPRAAERVFGPACQEGLPLVFLISGQPLSGGIRHIRASA